MSEKLELFFFSRYAYHFLLLWGIIDVLWRELIKILQLYFYDTEKEILDLNFFDAHSVWKSQKKLKIQMRNFELLLKTMSTVDKCH